jgi:hypothetical protein
LRCSFPRVAVEESGLRSKKKQREAGMADGKRKWQRCAEGKWRELLERQVTSGQSVEAFCRAQSLSTGSFYRWRRQPAGAADAEELTTQASSATPARVDLGALGDGCGGRELELALGGGLVLRLPGG